MAACAPATSMVGRSRRARWTLGVTVGAVALLVTVAAVLAFLPRRSTEPEPFREQPVVVEASGEPITLLSNDDLRVLAERVMPAWERPRVAALIHCLRFWGPGAATAVPRSSSSRTSDATPRRPGKAIPQSVARLLCDDVEFQAAFGAGPPFLEWNRDDLATRQGLDDRAAAHVDDLLAAAAEAGLTLSLPVNATGRRGTLADLLRAAIARFEIEQELEFTTVGLAAYLPPCKSWTNQHGATFTFDDVAHKLLEPVSAKQACCGTHGAYALAFLVRVDECEPILAPNTRQDVLVKLRRLSADLESRQDESGYWAPREIRHDPLDEGGDLAAFRVTGHHLEWIALAPPEVRPSAECIERAEEERR